MCVDFTYCGIGKQSKIEMTTTKLSTTDDLERKIKKTFSPRQNSFQVERVFHENGAETFG